MENFLETLRPSDYSSGRYHATIRYEELQPDAKSKPQRKCYSSNPFHSRHAEHQYDKGQSEGYQQEDSTEPTDELDEMERMGEAENRLQGVDVAQVADKRSAAPNDTWDRIRDELFSRFLSNSHIRAQRQSQQYDAACLEVQSEIDRLSAVCPTCGFRRIHARTEEDRVHITLRAPQRVLYVGVTHRFVVEVPVRLCGACGCAFSCCPLDLDCLPGSAIEAWNIVGCKKDHTPIWFSMGLVKFFEQGTNLMRRFSVYKAAEWLDRTHVDNGCTTVVAFDKLRKCLGVAIREWGYMMCQMNNMTALGVHEWPTGECCQERLHAFGEFITPVFIIYCSNTYARYINSLKRKVRLHDGLYIVL